MIKNLTVHLVGNKALNQDLILSTHPLTIDESLETHLEFFFLHAFKEGENYQFQHSSDLGMNEIYSYVSAIFQNPELLQEQSIHIAKHLFECSMHPNIKPGEFYVVYFEECILDGEVVDAIGLFKSENKDLFLNVEEQNNQFEIHCQEGINIHKLDKGCLIYNTEKENGFILSIIDQTNRGNEAHYWKDDFLNVMVMNNAYFQTQEVMQLTKKFVEQKLPEEFEISKADQIDLLNKSMEYFKKHDTYDKAEFEQEVFQESNVVQSFRKFDENYRENHELQADDQFALSPQAVKKQAKVFKSILKLDKNFHIYIHGKRDWIERGVDEDGRKFYKVYYENEA